MSAKKVMSFLRSALRFCPPQLILHENEAQDCGRGLAAVFWSDWAVLVIDSWDETQRGKINSIGMNFLFGAETALVFENVDERLVTEYFIVLLVFGVLIFQKCWIISLICVWSSEENDEGFLEESATVSIIRGVGYDKRYSFLLFTF